MDTQRFFKTADSQQILLEQAKLLREQAERMPHGVERDRLIKAARASETQAKGYQWADSSGLQPPTG